MALTGQVTVNTLVLQPGKKQQWLPALNFSEIFKKPAGKTAFSRNPLATSVPVSVANIENIVWHGSPSIWTIFNKLCVFAIILVVLAVVTAYSWPAISNEKYHTALLIPSGLLLSSVLWFLYQWIQLKTIYWTLSTERLTWEKGVFSKTVQNLELYRIKDIGLRKPFVLRLLGRGYVDFVTSDQSEKKNHTSLGAISRPEDLYALLRKYVERQRKLKGVKELDYWRA